MKKKNTYLLMAILIVGFGLRPSITGLGSLVKLIKPDMGLGDTAAGLLTTIPMIAFALFSPLTAKLNNKMGTGNTLFCGFGLIIIGCVVRSYLGLVGLFAGTLLIGIGISFGNVLMPAIIKTEFPQTFGFVTALNSAALAISSGIASGVNYPLATDMGLGWRNTLCLWAVLVVVCALVWFPVRKVGVETNQPKGSHSLMKNKIAWSVTLFLGLSALLFYSCMSWLSTIFQFKGLDAATAGYYVSAFQLMGILSSFAIPALAAKHEDQRKVTFGILSIFLVGIVMIALTTDPALLLIGAMLAGLACNGCFALSMTFIGFRASNGGDAARLSSMSQGFGYVIAACGPLGMGFIFQQSDDWNVNLWIIAILIVSMMAVSTVCAREGTV